jgi:hypothetical protein
MKLKHIAQSVRGKNHLIHKNIEIKSTDPLIISHNDHAKRFWIAQTYSGFCPDTISLPIHEIGEYFGHHKTLIRKSKKKVVTTIFNKLKS